MKKRPYKIGIAGTHSTGKSSLVLELTKRFEAKELRVGNVGDLASLAKEKGFPILSSHTYDSTLWIMATGMMLEAEASLHHDIIIVDRPVFDAVGYFEAALEISNREERQERVDQLRTIAEMHTHEYDSLVVTVLDPKVPLGEGRDRDEKFRKSAASHIQAFADQFAPKALRMTSENADDIMKLVIQAAGVHY